MERVGTILESLIKMANPVDLERQLIVMVIISKGYGSMESYTDFVSFLIFCLNGFDISSNRRENLYKQCDNFCL